MKRIFIVVFCILYIFSMCLYIQAAPPLPQGAIDNPEESGILFDDLTLGNHTISKIIDGDLQHFGITVLKDKNNNKYISRWVATLPIDVIWIKGLGGDTGAFADYNIKSKNFYGESNISYVSFNNESAEENDIKSVILWFAEKTIKRSPDTKDAVLSRSNSFLLFILSSLLLIFYIKIKMKKYK